MGTSTDAIVAFGFDLGEELPEALFATGDDDYFDFQEWVEARLGLSDADYAERSKAVAAFPFDLITHCSYDYPMYFLAARGTKLTAARGYPEPLALVEATPEQVQAMRAFCDEFGIAWQEPRWHTFSLWG